MALKLVSLLGMIVLLVCAWGCPLDRKSIPWRAVFWGLALQFVFAILILKTAVGEAVFAGAQRGVTKSMGLPCKERDGLWAPGNASLLGEKWGPGNRSFWRSTSSATIIVVSASSSLLYHWGILQRVVRAMAVAMQRGMRTSGSETLAAAANIFMGQTERRSSSRPYLSGMT